MNFTYELHLCVRNESLFEVIMSMYHKIVKTISIFYFYKKKKTKGVTLSQSSIEREMQ